MYKMGFMQSFSMLYTHQPAMFESSFLSDVIDLYYMLPNNQMTS